MNFFFSISSDVVLLKSFYVSETTLFEDIVLRYFGLKKHDCHIILCSAAMRKCDRYEYLVFISIAFDSGYSEGHILKTYFIEEKDFNSDHILAQTAF